MPGSMAEIVAAMVREVMGDEDFTATEAEWLADPASDED